jgi:hypothetical protein
MKNILTSVAGALLAATLALSGCAVEESSADGEEQDLNGRAGITCQVFSGNQQTAMSAGRTASLLAKSKLLKRTNESFSVSIPFRTLDGAERPMKVNVRRIEINADRPAFSDVLRVGADYSFNNPFEANSVFARNDLTGQTLVRGTHFVLEGEKNALDAVDTLRSKKNYSMFNPYLIMKMKAENLDEPLLTPDGQVTNYLVLSCVASS